MGSRNKYQIKIPEKYALYITTGKHNPLGKKTGSAHINFLSESEIVLTDKATGKSLTRKIEKSNYSKKEFNKKKTKAIIELLEELNNLTK